MIIVYQPHFESIFTPKASLDLFKTLLGYINRVLINLNFYLNRFVNYKNFKTWRNTINTKSIDKDCIDTEPIDLIGRVSANTDNGGPIGKYQAPMIEQELFRTDQ